MCENIDIKLKESIINSTSISDFNEVELDTDFIEDLHFDSLTIVMMLVEIEDTFQITFLSEKMTISNIRTYRDLYKLVYETIKQ